uniref:NR LBD domain-containing protein n=1 Tax=Bursaphelenchus xylophilus TaxID=6326 RepID=A0A1I7RVZ0_BURXY
MFAESEKKLIKLDVMKKIMKLKKVKKMAKLYLSKRIEDTLELMETFLECKGDHLERIKLEKLARIGAQMWSLKPDKTRCGMKIAYRVLANVLGHLKFSKFKMVNKDFMEKIEMNAVEIFDLLNGVIKFGMQCWSALDIFSKLEMFRFNLLIVYRKFNKVKEKSPEMVVMMVRVK